MIASARGDASYPEWINIKSNIEFFYKTPIRILYFLFSPFPWDVSKLIHLIGYLMVFIFDLILLYLW